MPYTQPTLLEAQTELASRLNDSSYIRWLAPELDLYLTEALRTWNAWTARSRMRGSFTTVANQTFYDLPTVVPSARAYTVTNWDLIADMQYALLEPAAAGGSWTGTDQFTLDQLTQAIQRRRNQFLRETGIVLTSSSTLYTSPSSDGRLALDERLLNIRRAAWTPVATQLRSALTRTTEWAGNNFMPAWPTNTQSPYAYSVAVTPPLTLQLIPPATGDGTLDLLALQSGDPVDPLIAQPLGIPDDFCWVVKYGALADVLNDDALTLDPARAQYCEQRWQEGLEIARRTPVTLTARINDVPVPIAAISDADSYSPLWDLIPGVPKRVLLTGGNLVALWPPPQTSGSDGAGTQWSITLDLVRNMPVPSAPADVLQIAPDIYDSILDLAQHLALFKEGPTQLEQSLQLLERAQRAAGITLRFQQAQNVDRASSRGQQQQDRRSLPEQLEDVVPVPVED